MAFYPVPVHLPVISPIHNVATNSVNKILTTSATTSLQFILYFPVAELCRTERIVFSFNFLTHIYRIFENAAKETAGGYRIIKRSHSSIRDDKTQDIKRQKVHGEDSAHARDRIFASRTASLRRADSLKSVGDRKACVIL